jgi:hypothetical protein
MTAKADKKTITDDLEIIDFFRVLYKSKEKLWLWQQQLNQDGQRPVHFCLVRKVDVLKKTVELTPLTDEGFSFSKGDFELFFYSRHKNIGFKFIPRELENHYIMLAMPTELNHLSDDLAKKISLVEVENEEENKHKRKQERKVAGEKQTVTLRKEEDTKAPKQFPLYDISAGGLALKTPDPGQFIKNEKVILSKINGQDLPNLVKGKVVSIRHITTDDLFKVGIQFIKD